MALVSIADADSSDMELVAAAQRGDRDAFGLLYERYARMVHGVLLARVPFDCVDDLVQDVFLTALERLATLRAPAAFPGWLAAMARNRATDHHRAVRPVSLPAHLRAADAGPQAEALAILAAIQSLPDAYRETLTLRLVEGMTGPEIARRTGLTPGSVRVNLHRGLKRLRDTLQPRRTEP